MTPRRLPVPLILGLFVLVGAISAIGFKIAQAAPRDHSAVPWSLTGIGGDGAASDVPVTSTVLRIHVEQWPTEEFAGDEWLDKSVSETTDAVTITLRLSDAYRARVAGQQDVGWYDTGGWVTVALRAPLGDRRLVDGATGLIVAERLATN